MSKHFFGLGNGKVSLREQERVQKALDDAGIEAEFVAVDAVGVGTRYWFECRNLGEPFDSRTASEALRVVGQVKTRRA